MFKTCCFIVWHTLYRLQNKKKQPHTQPKNYQYVADMFYNYACNIYQDRHGFVEHCDRYTNELWSNMYQQSLYMAIFIWRGYREPTYQFFNASCTFSCYWIKENMSIFSLNNLYFGPLKIWLLYMRWNKMKVITNSLNILFCCFYS